MAWMEIVTRFGVTGTFKTLSSTDQRMMIPNRPLPINILSMGQLEQALNDVVMPGGNKEVLLIEGYYPPKFGNWATHKVFRITYRCYDQEQHLIGKVMEKSLGNKEFAILSNLSGSFNTPKPFSFMYDEEMRREFPNTGGILWMSYIRNIAHFENCLVNYCSGKEERDYRFLHLAELLFSVWSTGLKHNDLRAHHLLFTGEDWFLIDFERSKQFSGEDDLRDELATLVGDSTLYLDRFTSYYQIEISGNTKKKYEQFLAEFLKLFNVQGLLNNRLLLKFLGFVQNKELKLALYGILNQ